MEATPVGLKGQRETVVCQVMADALEGVEPTGAALCAYDDGQVVEEFTTRGVVATGYTRWAREGASATARPPEGPFDHITLRLPHGREAQLRDVHLLGSRLTPTGSLWVHGANDEGIKSIGKRLEPLFDEVLTASTRRHCRVIEAVGPRPELRGDRESWVVNCQAEVGEVEVTWASVPGLFAHGRLDMATRMLLESLPPLTGTVLDFGCGAGVIGRTLVLRGDAITMHQSDVDALALEMAQRNVPEATAWLADGLPSTGVRFDAIVTNPPLHRGKATDPEPLARLIELAPAHLVRGGSLWLVTQGAQAVRADLERSFAAVEVAAQDRRFRLWRARTTP